MAALYEGLATSQAALVAQTRAVVSVIFPVVVGTILHGAPTLEKWVGIAAGMAGIAAVPYTNVMMIALLFSQSDRSTWASQCSSM